MRISEIYGEGRFPVSFEIFPPKGEMNVDELRGMIEGITGTDPAYISVTCSAGGTGSSKNTAELAGVIQREYGIPSVAHITCINSSKADVDEYVESIKSRGLGNVLALRGDRKEGSVTTDFHYAAELIGYLKKTTDFCIGAGCYPEGHVECESFDRDIDHLKEKQDAGADFLISQLFFDNASFFKFAEKARASGIKLPIDAGIMPFMGKSQITRMIFMCGASLPATVIRMLNKYENDAKSLMSAGMEYAAGQILELASSGIPNGIHIYSMNKPLVAQYEVKAIRDAGY
ncbi:MAG: methylenetetrahydrofolate reductase [Oscillospiraceae bacterium]